MNQKSSANVWIMNLIDNREQKPTDLSETKFEFCKRKGIVGIGWTDDQNKNEPGYVCANNAISNFQIGDLVWVKNPATQSDKEKYYLCEITSQPTTANDEEMKKNDIGTYCHCDYISVDSLSSNISENDLISRHAVEKANETICKETVELYELYKRMANRSDNSNEPEQKRKKRNTAIALCFILFAIALSFIIFFLSTQDESGKTSQISQSIQNTEKSPLDYLPSYKKTIYILKNYFEPVTSFDSWKKIKNSLPFEYYEKPGYRNDDGIFVDSNGLTFAIDKNYVNINKKRNTEICISVSRGLDALDALDLLLADCPDDINPVRTLKQKHINDGDYLDVEINGLYYRIGKQKESTVTQTYVMVSHTILPEWKG